LQGEDDRGGLPSKVGWEQRGRGAGPSTLRHLCIVPARRTAAFLAGLRASHCCRTALQADLIAFSSSGCFWRHAAAQQPRQGLVVLLACPPLQRCLLTLREAASPMAHALDEQPRAPARAGGSPVSPFGGPHSRELRRRKCLGNRVNRILERPQFAQLHPMGDIPRGCSSRNVTS